MPLESEKWYLKKESDEFLLPFSDRKGICPAIYLSRLLLVFFFPVFLHRIWLI